MTLFAPPDVGRRLRLTTSREIQLDREGHLTAMRDSAGRRFYEAETVERYALEREASLGGLRRLAGSDDLGGGGDGFALGLIELGKVVIQAVWK